MKNPFSGTCAVTVFYYLIFTVSSCTRQSQV